MSKSSPTLGGPQVAERTPGSGKGSVSSRRRRSERGSRLDRTGTEQTMFELELVSESLVIRPFGFQPSPGAAEWRHTPLMSGLDRLFNEIGTYLEFVAIARGR